LTVLSNSYRISPTDHVLEESVGKLAGKVAVVTGGTSGIGLATAKRFAQEGARVVVTGRSDESLAAARRELEGIAEVVRSDAAKLADIEALAQHVRDHYQHVDVLFINAGITKVVPIEAADEDHFAETMDINFRGPFFTVRHMVPLLRDGASIIFTGSMAAHRGMAGLGVYSASKAALCALARTVAAELAPRGIRANTISLGSVATSMADKLGLSPEAREAMVQWAVAKIALGRMAEPDEIARVALFLASEDSSFITGEDLMIDGGVTSMLR